MRIITGKAKGVRLKTLEGDTTRPTAERVKEAVFSMIQFDLEERSVLDLFAGSGQMALEALSRGAAECVFCDNSRDSIRLIKANIAHCKAQEGARVIPGDFRKTLANLDGQFDIILLDPPYDQGFLGPAFELIREHDLLAEDGVIVAEHRKEEDLPEEFCGYEKIKERKYGIIKLSIYC